MKNTQKTSIAIILVFAVIFSAGTSFSLSDTHHDLAPQQSKNVTFIEKSTGLDTPTKESGNTELELADMNNDGHLDVISVGDHGSPYINSQQHGIMVWLGDGGTTWSVHQVGNFGYGGIEAGDLNLDGFLDVVWGIHHDYSGVPGFGDTLLGAALGDGTAENWIPWATGLATNGEDWGMFECGLADFDCNGRLDLISQSFGCCNGYHLYENHGDGTWTQVWSYTGGNNNNHLETGDFNADGYPDFVGNSDAKHTFLGDGSFGMTMTQTGLPAGLWNGLDCGDMNNDGVDDLVLGAGSSGVHCYVFNPQNNDWDETSTGLPTSGSYYPQFGDIDGDGNLDIVAYDDPIGYTFLGDGAGNWVADATFSMPPEGEISAFVVDGDFDHDGREDIVIEAEQGSGYTYVNKLKAFSPWLEPTELTAQLRTPRGGEVFRSGSIRNIRWLAGVPSSQGDSTVDIQISHHGTSGPWETIASELPNNGCYQWLVDTSGSSTCRVKIIVTTSSSSVSAFSLSDFTILGFSVDAHGPYQGTPGQVIQYTGSAENGVPPYEYQWDFGDGNSSSQQNPTHSYAVNGNYTVVLSVTDATDITIQDRTWATINGDNAAPSTPEITGKIQGKPHVMMNFTITSTDPDDDNLFYVVDWGDETNSSVGPYASGDIISVTHAWSTKGTYVVRCQARDIAGAESDWGTLSVKIPFTIGQPVGSFLEWLFERFPHTFPFLRHFLGY
jgi:PKD repeat protein